MRRRRSIEGLVGALIALVVAAACTSGVAQDKYATAQAQLQAKESEQRAMVAQLQAKESELAKLQSAIPTVQSQLQVRDRELQATADQLRAKESELAKLQKATPAVQPPFGIAVETLDASGRPAYEIKPGALLAFVQSGMSYDSPADANYVTVVDVKSRKVLARAALNMPKGYQSHSMGVSTDARWIYVPSLSSGSKKLHIFDGRTLKLAQTLDVGAATHHVDEGAYKRTDKFIMVDTLNPDHGALILDPNKDNEVVGRIPFSTVLGRPYSAWSSPDGSFAYITVSPHLPDQKGWISKVDLSTYKETAFFPVGIGPVWVAFAADSKTAWVSNTRSNNVMQIKVGQSKDEKDEVVATVPVDGTPYGIVLTTDGKKLYAVNKTSASTSVYVIDTEARKVVKEINKVGKQPDHLFLSPDGKEVWVAENRGYQVSIIDTATDEVTGSIPMPGDTHAVRFVQLSASAATTTVTPRASTVTLSAAAPTTPAASLDANLVARGERIFQETALCPVCHGKDAKGVIGPNIRGKTANDIRFQLQNNPQMQSGMFQIMPPIG